MRRVNAAVLTVVLGLASSLAACRNDDAGSRPAAEQQSQGSPATSRDAGLAPAPANAVQHEMRLLLQALQGTVAAIADDDLARVPSLIAGIHDARAATDAAIEDGSYRPPKNAGNLETFRVMDDAFHTELVGLVKAAQDDDMAATTSRFAAVLRHCQGCHAAFRELPADTGTPAPTVH